jgi:hypothetical protein
MDDHLKEADEALGLTQQEGDLYRMHLMNLHGSGGVDNTDDQGNVVSRSSLYQATEQGPDGRWYNIPTVWGGKKEVEPWTNPATGQVHDIPNATALENVRRMGWDRFPSYRSPEEADARYEQMHQFMERDAGDYFAARGLPRSEPVVPDHGAPGQIDRSQIRSELEQNPALRDRLNQMVRGEVGSSASPVVRRIQMETAMNRALARGHSLEQALWDTAGHGSRGYYPPQSFTRGGFDEKTFGGDLEAVLAGSNYAGKYGKGLITGNASADVARHQFARGTPGFTLETGSGPESYFSEGPFKTQIGVGKPPMKGSNATALAEPAGARAPGAARPAVALEEHEGDTLRRFPYTAMLARAGNYMHIGELGARPSTNIEDRRVPDLSRMTEQQGEAWRQMMMKRAAEASAVVDDLELRRARKAKAAAAEAEDK